MEKGLNKISWQEFELTEIFDIKSTSSSIDRNKLIDKSGEYPYITRSEKSNGYDSFVSKQENKYNFDKANVITIGLDTQTVFYQPYPFYTGQNIQILSNPNLNKYSANFLIPLLKRQMEKFSWGGNGATLTRLKRSKILLPTNSENMPDFIFMENFTKHKEEEKLNRFKKYITNRLEELGNINRVEVLSKKKWKAFYLIDIFSKIQRGKRLKKSDHIFGSMPYISSTAMKNGVDNFISNKSKVRIFSQCLTIANSGSVGVCFYQPFEFIASDHVTMLSNKQFNKYIYHFISTVIFRLNEKYSFNREINDNRIQREKIMLPVDINGQPDYEYMENYMKKLEYNKLMEYLKIKQISI